MSSDIQSVRDDLAFLRALVGEDADAAQTRAFGEAYFASGLIYGGQMLLHAAQGLRLVPTTQSFALGIGLGPTLLFIPVLTWIIVRNRKSGSAGTTGRAIGRIFAAVGIANIVLVAIIGSVALRHHSLATWLIYPATVFVLQGTAWLFGFMMRRRAWHGLVAAGWFAAGLAMSLTVDDIPLYILFAGLGLWLCMALPGWLMLRSVRRPA